MKAFIVYCHPSDDSFTRNVLDAFVKGLSETGHEYEISDLYKMDFKTDMSEKEYLRDANYRTEPALADDVLAEQRKITEGECVQIMHIGSYDDEPASVALMNDFLQANHYQNDLTPTRLHHEIYLSDPRKTAVEKLKTVIRHPAKKNL